MESELKALQQQALATQNSLKQLQARDENQAYAGALPEVPAFPNMDGAVLGVAALMVLAFGVLWWYLWHRPKIRLAEAQHTAMPDLAQASRFGPPPKYEIKTSRTAAAPPPAAVTTGAHDKWSVDSGWGDLVDSDAPTSPFARSSPAMEFDPEAAASEVVRVRKSLAEKREARAQILEREDAPRVSPILPSVRAWLDSGVHGSSIDTADLPPANTAAVQEYAQAQDNEEQHEVPPQPPAQAVYFSLPAAAPEEVIPWEHAAIPAAAPDTAPETIPQTEPDTEGPMEQDYTITLALALESETLDLWPEARELANEVMESRDTALRSQAQALLKRLDQLEREAAQASSVWDSSL